MIRFYDNGNRKPHRPAMAACDGKNAFVRGMSIHPDIMWKGPSRMPHRGGTPSTEATGADFHQRPASARKTRRRRPDGFSGSRGAGRHRLPLQAGTFDRAGGDPARSTTSPSFACTALGSDATLPPTVVGDALRRPCPLQISRPPAAISGGRRTAAPGTGNTIPASRLVSPDGSARPSRGFAIHRSVLERRMSPAVTITHTLTRNGRWSNACVPTVACPRQTPCRG